MIIAADRLFDGREWCPEGTQIQVDASGTILRRGKQLGRPDRVLEGVLCPGWVNAHTHVELSFLRDKIPQGRGLVGFLEAVMTLRRHPVDSQEVEAAQDQALAEMDQSGVVALGDIANGLATVDAGLDQRFHLHRFIELIGWKGDPEPIGSRGRELMETFAARRKGSHYFRQTLVPHAPYSVSAALFQWIDREDPSSLISVHNLESDQEDLLYESGEGAFRSFLERVLPKPVPFSPPGQDAWSSYSQWISPSHPLLLVHNTYMSPRAMDQAMARYPRLSWCLCPRANLYIEGRLPAVKALVSRGASLCVGTDSLASNTSLSMIEELRVLRQAFPFLEWEQLLGWASYGGARALQMDGFLGQLKPGYAPGLVWIPDLEKGPSFRLLPSRPDASSLRGKAELP